MICRHNARVISSDLLGKVLTSLVVLPQLHEDYSRPIGGFNYYYRDRPVWCSIDLLPEVSGFDTLPETNSSSHRKNHLGWFR